MTERAAIELTGLVQGVGFRPFVHSLATELDLRGFVQNRGAHVLVDVEGDAAAVAAFVDRLVRDRPPSAVIDGLRREVRPLSSRQRFVIVESAAGPDSLIHVPPDVATCDTCLRDLFDPANRRYRHAFVSCARCGPRYSMIERLPFDRAGTAMAAFPLCPACASEYADPADRRFHAQSICCPGCGPSLMARDATGAREFGERALGLAEEVLAGGGIVAVKGIGGFHLSCDARNDAAVAKLRHRKRRPGKPLAVMLPGPQGQALAATLEPAARAALESAERPIVLLDRREVVAVGELGLSPHVAPGSSTVGVFLPYSPLHHLLLSDLNRPLVMTSGNRRDEPMATDDANADEQLGAIADLILSHDRCIVRRCDDSVTRVAAGRLMPIRRGRGRAPAPMTLAESSPQAILAAGADLKNTFCFVVGRRAYQSAHVGSLDTPCGFQALADSVARLGSMLGLSPSVIVHDLHPDFLSARVADQYPAAERIAVQHHHAHVLSCVAEHRHTGPVIGVAFDGAGLGVDGAVWGGEFLIVEGSGMRRAAHLAYVPLPGGDTAAREPWRTALAHLVVARAWSTNFHDRVAARVPPSKRRLVAQMIDKGVCSPPTSSVGRLFDAVAALTGLCNTVEFEGQAAMALEEVATEPDGCHYAFDLDTSNEVWRLHAAPVVQGIAADVEARRPIGAISAAFHQALADATVATAERIAQRTGIRDVVLTGGVFQNARLSSAAAGGLTAAGLRVLEHAHVPCNDGGLSLGQALFGVRLLRERDSC